MHSESPKRSLGVACSAEAQLNRPSRGRAAWASVPLAFGWTNCLARKACVQAPFEPGNVWGAGAPATVVRRLPAMVNSGTKPRVLGFRGMSIRIGQRRRVGTRSGRPALGRSLERARRD